MRLSVQYVQDVTREALTKESVVFVDIRVSKFFCFIFIFFFNDTATTEIYTLSLHDALPISTARIWVDHFLISEMVSNAMPPGAALNIGWVG